MAACLTPISVNIQSHKKVINIFNLEVEIDGATNITEIRNTTLGPPPPLDSLLSQSSSWAGIGEIIYY